MISVSRVWDAISDIRDPELDEPITELRFVTSCQVTAEGDVEIRLRLPTPQCAPNFAYLMLADTRDAVLRLPDIRHVDVRLEDHYTSEEINAAVARGEGFQTAFPGETDDDHLDDLREQFQRKAFLARQARLCDTLLTDGSTPEQLAALSVTDLRDLPGGRRCLELRARLGIPSQSDAPAFVSGTGEPFAPDRFGYWLRMARLVRTSLDVNGGICRSLLAVRSQRGSSVEEVT